MEASGIASVRYFHSADRQNQIALTHEIRRLVVIVSAAASNIACIEPNMIPP